MMKISGTELCTRSISAMACNVCHAPEICMLHTSANFEKSKTQVVKDTSFLKQIIFLKFGVEYEKRKAKNKVHLFTFYAKCNTETLRIIQKIFLVLRIGMIISLSFSRYNKVCVAKVASTHVV